MQLKWIQVVALVLCAATLVSSMAFEPEYIQLPERIDQSSSRSLCNTFGACTPSSRRSLCLDLGDSQCEYTELKLFDSDSSSESTFKDSFSSHARSLDASELEEVSGNFAEGDANEQI